MVVLDTNIVIDYLSGKEESKNIFTQYNQLAISIITHFEVMVGVQNNQEIIKEYK